MELLLGNKKNVNVNRSALLPDNYKSIMKELKKRQKSSGLEEKKNRKLNVRSK